MDYIVEYLSYDSKKGDKIDDVDSEVKSVTIEAFSFRIEENFLIFETPNENFHKKNMQQVFAIPTHKVKMVRVEEAVEFDD